MQASNKDNNKYTQASKKSKSQQVHAALDQSSSKSSALTPHHSAAEPALFLSVAARRRSDITMSSLRMCGGAINHVCMMVAAGPM